MTDPIGTAQERELIEGADAAWLRALGETLPDEYGVDVNERLRKIADALQSRIAEAEQMRAALPIFERVTRLAHNLASDVPITAAARKHIQAAYDELAALSLQRRPT